MGVEQPPDALADEVVVLREHEPDRHAKRILALTLVLIVDDNELNRKLDRDLLRRAGFDTVESATGADALTLAVERVPDVILMDLRLPDMDGTEVTRRLRADPRTARIPVLAVSALPLEEAGDWLAGCGLRRLDREADPRRPLCRRRPPPRRSGHEAMPRRRTVLARRRPAMSTVAIAPAHGYAAAGARRGLAQVGLAAR